MRNKVIKTRKTTETDVTLEFSIDGKGRSDINTPVSFLNHMLELFTLTTKLAKLAGALKMKMETPLV